jgi:GntR family transcriptional regulator, transcriptional repressor for pyruvate dehydrogenase complex
MYTSAVRTRSLPEGRETTVDACTRWLRQAILRGELAAGSRLPPERQLAEQLGVTRVTLRSALAQLAATGLLRARQGSGHTVQDFRRAGGPDLLAGLAELAVGRGDAAEVARDLLAVRRALARVLLERLAEGVGEEAQLFIAAAIDELEARVDEGASTEEIAEADLDVIAALVTATGSDVLGVCLNPVIEVSRRVPSLREALYAEPRENVDAFRVLLAWLRAPRPDAIGYVLDAMAERDARTLKRMIQRKGGDSR